MSSPRSSRPTRNASSARCAPAGSVVGYLGDGINDAPALHAADVGISVDSGVDVAKQAAAIVLLDKDLGVLLDGVRQGRRTFANTMKYVFTTTSASFGNVLSMAIASIVLPFLPLLAEPDPADQLPDRLSGHDDRHRRGGPGAARAAARLEHRLRAHLHDRFRHAQLGVRPAHVRRPAPGASTPTPRLFRSGWFVESIATELAVMFVLRTRRPFFRSRPSLLLLGSSVAVGLITLVIPYSPARRSARSRSRCRSSSWGRCC